MDIGLSRDQKITQAEVKAIHYVAANFEATGDIKRQLHLFNLAQDLWKNTIYKKDVEKRLVENGLPADFLSQEPEITKMPTYQRDAAPKNDGIGKNLLNLNSVDADNRPFGAGDIYSNAEYEGSIYWKSDISPILQRLVKEPVNSVTIYRAVPDDVSVINPGDWITLSHAYANLHLAENLRGKGKVISMDVSPQGVYWNGWDLEDMGYDPFPKTEPEDLKTLRVMPEELNSYGLDRGFLPSEPKPSRAPAYQRVHPSPTNDGFSQNLLNLDELASDVYDNVREYCGAWSADIAPVLRRLKLKPETPVTIYRAVPDDVSVINPGDWITLSHAYANLHLAENLRGKGKVISMNVAPTEVFWDGNGLVEMGYDPREMEPA